MNYITLPFSPLDLVNIYASEEKVLKVDLTKSLKNINVNQLLVYISNTKFEVEFNDVTNELLVAYMETDFHIKSPQLSRIILEAIHGITEIPAITEHIKDFKSILKAVPNYVLDNINKYSEGTILAEKIDFEYIDTKLSLGFNGVRLLSDCQLLLLELMQDEGVVPQIYTHYMNTLPRYSGSDFYLFLHKNEFMPTVVGILSNLIKQGESDDY